jgi:hypothetical protein
VASVVTRGAYSRTRRSDWHARAEGVSYGGVNRLVLGLVVAALFAAGCGAAGKTGDTGNGDAGANTGGATGTRGELVGEDDTVGGQTAAFRAGVTFCNLYPLEELARQEGVKATPEAVAQAYSKFESDPKNKKEAYNGCLSVLKKQQ